ncbi:MAG TPA: PilZ domain-containing protein [Polyangiaceae bacterium]|nr:PilZ domain-containing protein [Polyangiaceae bacterium]
MESRSLLALGKFRREERAALAVAAQQAAFELHAVDSSDEASDWLSSHDAHAALLESEQSAGVAVEARSSARHVRLPMLALARSVSDLAFNDAFSWGADDVLPFGEVRPLLTRLRNLPREQAEPPKAGRGNALVAEADRTRRTVVARVLRNAGYAVTFAVTAEDAVRFAERGDLALAVVSSELVPDTRPIVEHARAAGSNANFIVCCAPRNLRSVREGLESLPGVAAVDGFAAPENVLFASNELCAGGVNNRKSARLLYGTTVAFRGAGRERDDLGFTYNVSSGGLYVRTMAPPDDDEAWIELRPPRSDRLVRLVVKIAWRRRFNHNENATVPPGFGAQIIDGAHADIAAWNAGYNAMSAALG